PQPTLTSSRPPYTTLFRSHRCKIAHSLQKDGGAHNLLQTAASRLQDAGKVFYRAIGLRSYIACNELLVRRINRHLPRYKNESIQDRKSTRLNSSHQIISYA